jgi:NAD(P)-dependent dehydrogenase (short-subunit alcohol dehydrogenase family)
MSNHSGGRLAGKTALITGGSSGLGRATAERFAEEGADIVIADRDAHRGAEAAREIKARHNCQALFIETDVASADSVDAMADRVMDEFGRIDTVVAAAGISNAGYVSGEVRQRDADLESRLLVNLDVAAWQRVLDVNLTGVMLTDRGRRPGT